ncbi:MAG: 1,4-alpha-glucan branching protein [Chitinophagaceae bacterium]
MSKEWIYRTNVYEVNVRQYTNEGTFTAFALHLPRLKDMGVQTLWFMPITPIAQKGKKGSLGSPYACSDYTSINPEFGTLDDFKNLVYEAHEMGFKVIIDWVANHTGWDHVWTKEHPDYYKKDETTGDFKIASGMDDIIELDYSNREMRKAMIAAMQFWIDECCIDGFRCDLAFWVQLDFWIEAKEVLEKTKPLFWLGELDSLEKPEYMQVFDAAYTWTWMHQTEKWYRENLSLYHLKNILDRYHSAPGIKAWFTSNHDENTWNGTEYEKYSDAAKALAVFSCTWPGIPLIYNGQELPNHKRLAFFEKDPIEWKEYCELHQFYKALLQLRSSHPALGSNAEVFALSTNNDENVLAYRRKIAAYELIVLLNLSKAQTSLRIVGHTAAVNYENILINEKIDISKELVLSPWDYLVLTKS